MYHAVIDTTTDSSNSIATLIRWLHESIDDSETSSLDLRRVGTEDDFGTEYSSKIKSAADKKLEVTMEEKEILDWLATREKDSVLNTPADAVGIAKRFTQVRLELGKSADTSEHKQIESKERVTWKQLISCLRSSDLLEEAALLWKMMNQDLVLSTLHQVLFGFMHTSIVEHSEILMIPDGELWVVPWGGLIYSTEADASSRHFMIERHPLRTAPSLRIVRAVAVAECEDDSEGKSALVMAHSYGQGPATIDKGKLVSRLLIGTGTYNVTSCYEEDVSRDAILAFDEDHRADWFHFEVQSAILHRT